VVGRNDVVALPTSPPLRRRLGWVQRRGRHLPAIAFELLELMTKSREASSPLPSGS
jgi:hypothetical protein